jgi:hypothetical protein
VVYGRPASGGPAKFRPTVGRGRPGTGGGGALGPRGPILGVGWGREEAERLVSRFSPTFKDTNKKASIYVIIEIRVSQKNRWITLGFELPILGNGARKRSLLTVQNRDQVHRKPTGDLVPFSPRRVLPRFVNPRIGSILLGFSI